MISKGTVVLAISIIFSTSAYAQSPDSIDPVCSPGTGDTVRMCLGSYDPAPLGDRIPLLLIHGLNWRDIPGGPDLATWDPLTEYLATIPWVSEYYKIYRVNYISNLISVRDLGRLLARLVDAMDAGDSSFAGKQMIIIGHSMGGLVARSFMEEARLRSVRGPLGGERVLKLITLGTPHHGAPIANGPARDDKAGTLVGPLIEMFDGGLFNRRLTWSTYNRYDLHWDNFDQFFDYERFPQDDNLWLRSLNANSIFRNKMSVYMGLVEPQEGLGRCIRFDFKCFADVMRLTLGITETDGVVPLASASFSSCVGCVSRQLFHGYDHAELVSGREPSDSNLFGAIGGDLSELVFEREDRFNDFVFMGDPDSEPFHNLRNWGELQDAEYGQVRGQAVGGRSSFDLFVGRIGVDHVLLLSFVNTDCDDSFVIHVNGEKVFSFGDGGSAEPIVQIEIDVNGKFVSKRRVTITFENRSSDGCGTAPVYTAGLFHNGII